MKHSPSPVALKNVNELFKTFDIEITCNDETVVKYSKRYSFIYPRLKRLEMYRRRYDRRGRNGR